MGALVIYDQSFVPNNRSTYSLCYGIVVDGTDIQFYGNCQTSTNVTAIGGVNASVSVISSQGVLIENPFLHTWENVTGDLGLAYCTSSSSCRSPFQDILANAASLPSNNQTFALDFRDPNSSIVSIAAAPATLLMGGVNASYEASLVWSTQPSPEYTTEHKFTMQNLQFCGGPLLGNISRTFPVLVDTGAACLTLPEEIYIHFEAWFDNSSSATNPVRANELPAFSFEMSAPFDSASQRTSNQQIFYLPLGMLLLNPGEIRTEAGAPFVQVLSDEDGSTILTQRLCVLKGNSLGSPYNSPASPIVLGALTLQSLYFAANFDTVSVGLANKLSDTESAYYKTISAGYLGNSNTSSVSPFCARVPSCRGGQTYAPASNECKSPNCKQYFFTSLDEDTQLCVTKASPYYFGIIFISFIVALECISFFVGQYTASVLLAGKGGSGSGSSPVNSMLIAPDELLDHPTHRMQQQRLRYKVGSITLWAGYFLSGLLDALFQFQPPQPPANTNPSSHNTSNNNSRQGTGTAAGAGTPPTAGQPQLTPALATRGTAPPPQPPSNSGSNSNSNSSHGSRPVVRIAVAAPGAHHTGSDGRILQDSNYEAVELMPREDSPAR